MEVNNGSLSFAATIEYKQLVEAIRNIEKRLSGMESVVANAGDSFDRLGESAGNTMDILAKGFAAIGGAAALKGLAKQAFETRSFFQDATSAMTVFLGSADRAEEHLSKLQDYAWYNVFDFEQLVSASKQLQAFGTDVEDVIPIIDNLSNIAAGTDVRLEEFVAIYNKAKSLGKIDLTGLQQFATRGLDLKKVLSEMGEVTSGTAVSFEQLQKAIEYVNREGGMFAGLMDEQFNNLSSQLGAVQDDWSQIMNHLGEMLQDSFVSVLTDTHEMLSSLDENLEKFGKVVVYVAGAWGVHKAAMLLNTVAMKMQMAVAEKEVVINSAQKKLIQSLTKDELLEAVATGAMTKADLANLTAKQRLILTTNGLRVSMKKLGTAMVSNIWVAVAVAVAKVIEKLVEMRNEAHAVGDAYNDASGEVEKSRLEFNDLMKTLTVAKKGTDSYKETVDKLNKEYAPYLKNINLEHASIEEVNAARERGLQLLREEAIEKAKGAAVDKAYEQQAEARATYVERTSKLLEGRKDKNGETIGARQAKEYANQLADMISEMDFDYAAFVSMVNPLGESVVRFAEGNEETKEKLKEFNKKLEEIGIGFYEGNGTTDIFDFSTNGMFQNFAKFASVIYNTTQSLLNYGIGVEEAKEKTEDFTTDLSTGMYTSVSSISENIEQARKDIKKYEQLASQTREVLKENGELVTVDNYLTDDEKKALEDARTAEKSNLEEYEKMTGESYDKRGETIRKREQELSQMRVKVRSESYAKERELVKLQGEQAVQDLELYYENNLSTMSDNEKSYYEEKIELQKKLNRQELQQMDEEHRLKKAKAIENIRDLMQTRKREQEDYENELAQYAIDKQAEGTEKELAQMQLDRKRREQEIERQTEDEKKASKERIKQEWLNSDVNRTEQQFKDQFNKEGSAVRQQYEQEASAIDQKEAERKRASNEQWLKEDADFLNDMLSKYGEYTESKRRIDEEYSQNLNYLNEQMANAATEQQKQQIQEAIGNLKTEWAQKQFDLDMEVFDSSYFDSVDSKMQALNGVYAAYISNLVKAGASQEQLNAVTREWNSLTGKPAQLNAKLEDLEQEKALAVERGDIDLVKALNGEMSKLRKEQDKMQKDGEKKDFKTSLLDWWDENKKDLIVDGIDKIGGSIRQLGEASGNTGLKDLGEAVEGIGGLVQGFAQGGLIGGIVNAVSMIADEVVNVISANKQLEQAIEKANVDSWVDRMEASMDTDGIFGEDSVANVNASLKVIEEAKKKLDEVWKGGKVNAQDRSGFANFFGIKDDYRDLGDMARELGRDLYDSYGNLNSDTLQAILDTYSDLGAEDRKWMEEAIAYSDEYAEAMENVASYLEDLFGGVAGDIADKMVDAFIETGNAAVDLGDVVSDVGKKMAKDLIKSMIISTYFEGMEDDFKRRIAENGMNSETSSYIIGEVSKAVQAIEGDMTYWNNVISSLSGLWSGAAEDASATLGTSLGAASQESIDMMTGQLNAIRTHQITIESRVDSVLLSLAGIRQDMNSNARNAEGYLDKIEINTRSTNNSLIRGFGL